MLITILTIGFVVLVVGFLRLMWDVRDLMASVSDVRFRLARIERRIFEGRPPDGYSTYPNKWKPWA